MALIRRIVVAALALFLFIAPARVEARPIALAWDVNSEPSVTGYTLFYGTQSGVYTTSIDVDQWGFSDAVGNLEEQYASE